MLHLFYFITRKAELDEAAFHRYWREVHGPIVRRIPHLERYVQSHEVAEAELPRPFDGAAEAWVKDAEQFLALRECPEYLEGALADEPNFIDMNRVAWLVTRDRVILDGPQNETQIKTVSRVRRKEGLSVEAFREHWAEVHGPIACALPGIERYVQSATIDDAYTYGEPRFDGVAQIWVKDLAALRTLRESETYTVDAMQDASKFLDTAAISAFAARETQVIWPDRNSGATR